MLLDKQYFNVKIWGEHNNFFDSDENISFESWLQAAKEQELPVKWENNIKKYIEKLKYGF